MKHFRTEAMLAACVVLCACLLQTHDVPAQNKIPAKQVTLQIIGNTYVETYFPSLGMHNAAGGLEPSDAVNNFIPEQLVRSEAIGAKPDAQGMIRIPAASSPYYKLDRLRLYMQPGATLSVDLKSKRYAWDVTFSGPDAAANTWLNQELLNVYMPLTRHTSYFDTLQSYHDYSAVIGGNVNQVREQLQALPASAKFKKDEDLRINFLNICALINYCQYNERVLARAGSDFTKAKHDSVMADVNRLMPEPYKETYNNIPEAIMALEYLSHFDPAYVTKEKFPGFSELHMITSAMSRMSGKEFLFSGELNTMATKIKDPALHKVIQGWQQVYGRLQQGQPAPDIDLKDKDDHIVKLSSLKGKMILVDCWATWCNPCLQLKPEYEKLAENNAGGDIIFVALSTDKDVTKWKNFIATHPAPANVKEYVIVNDKAFSKAYQVQSIPRFMLIDAQFKLIDALAPRPGDEKLNALLAHTGK